MEGKITKIHISDGSLINHSTGIDSNLDDPSDVYAQNNCFMPMTETQEDVLTTIKIGSYQWTAINQGVGTGKTITGNSAGSAYGILQLVSTGSQWNNFASGSFNGIQKIYFPKSATNDQLGGYVDFYYHQFAFQTAFSGNTIACIISIDGSIYKQAVLPNNLVVNSFGDVGKAGGGIYIPNAMYTQNDSNSISDEVIQISKFGENIIL